MRGDHGSLGKLRQIGAWGGQGRPNQAQLFTSLLRGLKHRARDRDGPGTAGLSGWVKVLQKLL